MTDYMKTVKQERVVDAAIAWVAIADYNGFEADADPTDRELLDSVHDLTEATGPNPTESTSAADGMSGTARSSGAASPAAESSSASIPSASSKFKVGDKVRVAAKWSSFKGNIYEVVDVNGPKTAARFDDCSKFYWNDDEIEFVEDAKGFKIGDRVKIVGGLWHDMIGTLTRRRDFAWAIEVNGLTCFRNNDKIEHYTGPKFKVGDRVRIKDNSLINAGEFGIVAEDSFNCGEDYVRVEIDGVTVLFFERSVEPYDGFMPGDRVRRIAGVDSPHEGVVKRAIYIVKKHLDDYSLYLDGIDADWTPSHFELVKP